MPAQNGKPDLSGAWSPEPRPEASHPKSPAEVVILYEAYTTFRQVFTDGRPLPEDPQPSWMGYSVGKWEGDTLIVETSGVRAGAARQGWQTGYHRDLDAEWLEVSDQYRRRPETGRGSIPAWGGRSIQRTRNYKWLLSGDSYRRPAAPQQRTSPKHFRRKDYGHMDIQITIDDPKAYTKPGPSPKIRVC